MKSSFIYLANAVNDLRGNWTTLAVVLAPLVALAALCLMPDALNLQGALTHHFVPGAHDVGWIPAQIPYAPAAAEAAPLFAPWMLTIFHLGVLILTVVANLLVLVTIRRIETGVRKPRVVEEAIAIYGEAIVSAPAFAWVVLLQLGLPAIAVLALRTDFTVSSRAVAVVIYLAVLTLLVLGSLIYLWLYFAPFALIFNGEHSFRALLFSRDLLRKRFFRVATRILVFLAVWSGYNSWAAIFFVVVSLILGPVAVLTGYIWGTILIVDIATVAVTYATTAFFIAAGVRLFQDLREVAAARVSAAMPPTVPLGDLSAPAAR